MSTVWGCKQVLHETAPPDASYSRAMSALQSCLEKVKTKYTKLKSQMSAAKLSQTKKSLVHVQAEPRVSVRSYCDETNQASRNEHVQSVEMGELRR